jgi:uncharacterized protein
MVTTIVKPTRDCNLGCKYCYTEIRDTGERISPETILAFFKKIKKYETKDAKGKSSTHIIWHGGEPLLMGLDFYKKVVEMQTRLSTPDFCYVNSV